MKWLTESFQTLNKYNQNVRNYILGNLLIQVGMGVFGVMYNLYISELHLGETVNGKVISVASLATAIMLIPAGLLSDKFGRRKMILIGTCCTVFLLFGRSIVVTEMPMLVFAFAGGIVWALVQVSGIPFLAENSRSDERMKLFSFHFALVTIAGVVGNLLGGIIADAVQYLTPLNAAQSIRVSLLVGVAIFTCGIIPLLKLKPNVKNEDAKKIEQQKETGKEGSFRFNLKMIALFSFANWLIGTGSGLVIPYLNLYFANRFDASNSYIGFILALGSAMTAVAMLIGPALVNKVGKVRALVIFQLSSIPFLFLTAYTSSLILASFGFLMRQALMNAGNPITSAIAMDVVSDKYKGLGNSVNQMVFNIGWATMGVPSMWLVVTFGSYWGYAYAFSITGVLYLISSIYFYFVFGRKYALKNELLEQKSAVPK